MGLRSILLFKPNQWIFRGTPEFPVYAAIMDPQTVTQRHSHECTECVFVVRGGGTHQSGTRPGVRIGRGDILIIPPGGRHAYLEADAELSVINLLFDGVRLPPILLDLYSKPAFRALFPRDASRYADRDFALLHPGKAEFDRLEFFARAMAECGRESPDHCRKLGFFMILLSFLVDVAGDGPHDVLRAGLDVRRIADYLQNSFHRPVYLEELAFRASMSKATLLRHFKGQFGMTPMAYLQRIRLRHAAELLSGSELSVKEVAEASGFPTEAYFFRAFKKNYGVSPVRFRETRA